MSRVGAMLMDEQEKANDVIAQMRTALEAAEQYLQDYNNWPGEGLDSEYEDGLNHAVELVAKAIVLTEE